MFKCEEQMPKYQPAKLSTFAQVVIINQNINISCLRHISDQLPSEVITVVYKSVCLYPNCYEGSRHWHFEESNQTRFFYYNTFFRDFIAFATVGFANHCREVNIINASRRYKFEQWCKANDQRREFENKKRAIKRRLDF